MKALLLAAGVGSRLRPITDHLPKCLVPIRGVPLLAIWLERLTAGGVTDILVNTHHHAELVQRFVRESPWRDCITLAHEPMLLGTGGTVLQNAGWCSSEAFILAHADNLTLFDPSALLRAHHSRPSHCELTMMTFATPDPRSCGVVECEPDGTVRAFHEKVPDPPGNLANAAVYVFERPVVECLEAIGRPVIDISTELLPRYLGRMMTFRNSRYHRDIGTVASLAAAQTEFPEGEERTGFGAAWLAALRVSDPLGVGAPDLPGA